MPRGPAAITTGRVTRVWRRLVYRDWIGATWIGVVRMLRLYVGLLRRVGRDLGRMKWRDSLLKRVYVV